MEEQKLTRIRGMLGFARRAGKLVIGTELTCRAMAKRGAAKPRLVVISNEASDATKEKLHTKAEFYQIPAVEVPLGMSELGHLLGKTTTPACTAVIDEGFAGEIEKLCHADSMKKGSSPLGEEG